MAYKFKVGETYKTRSGEDRLVIYEYPDGRLATTDPRAPLGLGTRLADGTFHHKGEPSSQDLMPPTRKVVFPERWAIRSQKGAFTTCSSKGSAEDMKKRWEEDPRYFGKVVITHIPELTIEEEIE